MLSVSNHAAPSLIPVTQNRACLDDFFEHAAKAARKGVTLFLEELVALTGSLFLLLDNLQSPAAAAAPASMAHPIPTGGTAKRSKIVAAAASAIETHDGRQARGAISSMQHPYMRLGATCASVDIFSTFL